ncbi:MAG TPA: FAD-dependent oxidoreductase [Actinomycetaceae bacterium]|nr:FAD-dependent oxidoreductase [Actinomycetaceae bacterium]
MQVAIPERRVGGHLAREDGKYVMAQPTRPSHDVDVVVVGAGPAGENVAERVAAGGMSVTIVEGELAGGECSYWGCAERNLVAAARGLPAVSLVTRLGPRAAHGRAAIPWPRCRRDSRRSCRRLAAPGGTE